MQKVKRFTGVLFGFITFIMFTITRFTPDLVELIYTNGFYFVPRFIYRISFYFLPFALFSLVFLVAITLSVRHFYKKRRKKNSKPSWLFFLNLIGWLYGLFYWLWAFNYNRPDFEERQNFQKEKPNFEFLLSELEKTDSLLILNRNLFWDLDTVPVPQELLPKGFDQKIIETQNEVLDFLNAPKYPKSNIRALRPAGSLLRIKTAGVYFPYSMEGNYDSGLHALEKPFVVAHELAHINAFTDEGVCNFIAFLTCINSDDPFIRYSGWLEYHSYLYRNLRFNFKEEFNEAGYSRLSFVREDIKAIIKELDKYPNILPKLRDIFYDQYLKTQGVHDGIESYSQILQLVKGFKSAEKPILIRKPLYEATEK